MVQQEKIKDEYLTVKMVGDILHIGKNKVYKLFNLPGFPYVQIGNKKLVEAESMRDFLRDHQGSRIKLI